jgi:uncharacterized protein YeaO (DUF488 family)
MSGSLDVRARRICDDPPPDGTWVLVDRVWPRGLAKEAARTDEWARAGPRPAARTRPSRPLTLLTATRDLERSQAWVLAEHLRGQA